MMKQPIQPTQQGALRRYWQAVLWLLLSASSAAFAQVGVRQMHAGAMPITLVYPTAVQASTQTWGPFTLQLAVDAPPAGTNGRLIVFSHGTGGNAWSLHRLAATLARAGFVVAQPEHAGDNWQDQSQSGPASWQQRPAELSASIDAVARDPMFAGRLYLQRVGVYGMSAGGGTGLAMAGGEWSVATLIRHCAAHVREDAGFCLYGARSAAEAQQRAQSYKQALPAGAAQPFGGPLKRDRRVAAVALSVPVGAIFTAQSLSIIAIPVGLVQAQADTVLLPSFHSAYVLANCGRCVSLDAVPGGGHFDTLSPWPDSIASAVAAMPGGGRNPAVTDERRQQSYDAISRFFAANLLP